MRLRLGRVVRGCVNLEQARQRQPAYFFRANGLLPYFEAERAPGANQTLGGMRRRELLEEKLGVKGNAVQCADTSQRPDEVVPQYRLNQSLSPPAMQRISRQIVHAIGYFLRNVVGESRGFISLS